MRRAQVVTILLIAVGIIYSGSIYAQTSIGELDTAMKMQENMDSGSSSPSPGILNRVRNSVGAPGTAPQPANLPPRPPTNPVTRMPGSTGPGSVQAPRNPMISRPGGPMTQPGAKPGTAPMGPAPIDRKVEVAPGAFVPTQAAQQANRAFYLMHTRQFDEALKAYKGAMQYEEEKYKPVYDRVNSFFEKVRSSSDKGKAFSEVEETVLSEDPVPVKVKDYYVWRKLQPGRPQQVQQRPQGQPGYMMMPPGGIMPSGSMTNQQPRR